MFSNIFYYFPELGISGKFDRRLEFLGFFSFDPNIQRSIKWGEKNYTRGNFHLYFQNDGELQKKFFNVNSLRKLEFLEFSIKNKNGDQ